MSCGSCNKLPPTWWHKTREINSLIIWKPKVQNQCQCAETKVEAGPRPLRKLSLPPRHLWWLHRPAGVPGQHPQVSALSSARRPPLRGPAWAVALYPRLVRIRTAAFRLVRYALPSPRSLTESHVCFFDHIQDNSHRFQELKRWYLWRVIFKVI